MRFTSNKELLLLSLLRQDSRKGLTEISKKTGIPVSTVFSKLKEFQGRYISRFTCVLNYENLGYNVIANMLIKVKKQDKENLANFLRKTENVNSVFRVNNGFDFLVNGIFKSLNEVESFVEEMDMQHSIIKNQVYYVIERIKEEGFLADPLLYSFNSV